jgi:hypothetical protein
MCHNKVLKTTGIIVFVVIIFVVIVGLVLVSQTYLRRGVWGRLRSASDIVSEQRSFGSGQYEPYYLDKAVSSAGGVVSPNAVPARKLIKTSKLTLKVKDCGQVQTDIQGIVAKFNGIIIDSQLNQSSQFLKNGTIIFKIPPKDLEAALADVKKLGEVEFESVTGEDVTEQYVDSQARLKNFVQVKERLNKILNERAREVKDILDIEREMARVGGEIEALEGRIKYLDRQVDLSTVTVYFHEKCLNIIKAMNFGEKFMNTLRVSAETFVNTFNGVIIAISFLLPILMWLGIIWAVVMFFKRISRKS